VHFPNEILIGLLYRPDAKEMMIDRPTGTKDLRFQIMKMLSRSRARDNHPWSTIQLKGLWTALQGPWVVVHFLSMKSYVYLSIPEFEERWKESKGIER